MLLIDIDVDGEVVASRSGLVGSKRHRLRKSTNDDKARFRLGPGSQSFVKCRGMDLEMSISAVHSGEKRRSVRWGGGEGWRGNSGWARVAIIRCRQIHGPSLPVTDHGVVDVTVGAKATSRYPTDENRC